MKGTETLAARMGTTVHRSLLLHKLCRLGLKDADAISSEAKQRGLDYYLPHTGLQQTPQATARGITSEELVVALVHPGLPWDPQRFRLAAALMADSGVNARRLATLAIQERTVATIGAIATEGQNAEPSEPFWKELLMHLPQSAPVPAGVMPHPSRYMVIPGKIRPGRVGKSHWVRPRMLSE